MTLFPISLKLHQKKCIVIGGGKIAERKINTLIQGGAQVLVISPDWTSAINLLINEKMITGEQRRYQKGDLKGAFLVIAATNNPEVNAAIYKEAQDYNILINCIDDPVHCDFYFPAIVQKGDLQVTISTNGKAPILAKRLQEKINNMAYATIEEDLEAIYTTRKNILALSNGNDMMKMATFEKELFPLIDKLIQKLMTK